ncbi:hypothetical protein HN832_03840 [archaeon]|jgi:rRNA-processing protein FCF1|nr:hypothetical protein [archaeon]MBT4373474.1 hypothetical protein [archaeon]MBT4531922.1 hypothetical protein [archaeon]MBT7001589.1 hypothetical protein [archaeon]MBT7282519.1 hypothetical protein [archaeon]
MKKVLLDSSFLISAAKKKIDLFEELQDHPEIMVPEQVIQELFKISQSKQSLKNRNSAELAIKILDACKDKFKKIDISEGKSEYTDKQIIKYLDKNKAILLATLDKELKLKFKGKLIVLRGNKIERQ